MKTVANEKLEKFQRVGPFVRINFGEVESTTEEGEKLYTYSTAKVGVLDSRDAVVEAIMKVEYPNYACEIAAIANGGEDAQAHLDFRVLAKELADEFIAR